jgi:predicted metal-dependent hydrolase
LRILVASREVVLTMPTRGSVKHAKEFAQKHSAWITSRLRRLPGAAPFVHGAFLPLRGHEYRIDHRPGARGTVWIETHGNELLLCVAGEKPHLSRRVHDYLKREAKRDLQAASQSAAQALGIAFKRVSVRDQSSRWGSCSSSGVLSYSWRLVMAPPFVLEYLAAHEVAHLIEMNHSRRFWRLVEGICPHMGRAKAWLDAHGADLHRYGLDSR